MANTFGNFIRDVWAPDVQELAMKSFVAKKLVKMIDMPDGDVYHKPYNTRPTVGTYTRNATSGAVTPSDIATTDESLTVSTAQYAAFYVDDLDERQAYVELAGNGKMNAVYALTDALDTAIFLKYADATSTVTGVDVSGQTAGQGINLATGTNTLINTIAAAKAKLAAQNVREHGDWVLFIDFDNFYKRVETFSLSAGFRFADGTLENGFQGTLNGLKIYASNNLARTTLSNHSVVHWILAKEGSVSLAMQKELKMEAMRLPQNTDGTIKLGTNYIVWNFYGLKTFVEGARQMVDIAVRY